MKKNCIAFAVAAALLISILSMGSVFAAEEPIWIWYPAEDGYVTDPGQGTAEDAEDGSYTTFTSEEGTVEGYFYPGSAAASLSGGGLDQIDTIATVALVKYRTTAPESVNAQFAWHNGAAHGFKSFPYTGDGEWHFAITDLTTDTDAGSGPWTDALMINWFRFDFANNYTAEDPAYSVDLAYIAMFESEEDAQAYAEEDGGATFPGADDNDDQQGGEDEGKDEPMPPQTGDISVIVAVAAAALVLTILLKKRLAV